jgi:hypothetical protein
LHYRHPGVGKREDQFLIASLGPVAPGQRRYVVDAALGRGGSAYLAKCLFDNAADLNLVSHLTVKKMGLSRPPAESAIALQWGNSPTFRSLGAYVLPVKVTDAYGFTGACETEFHAVALTGMGVEAILGLPWLEIEDPEISYKVHRWRFPLEERNIELVKKPVMKRLIRKKKQVFTCCLTEVHGRRLASAGQARAIVAAVAQKGLPEEFLEYSDVSDEGASRLAEHSQFEHGIELVSGGELPFGPLYALSERELEVLRENLDAASEKGWIRLSTSPAGAPILFVLRKDAEMRLCVDYRGLNKITIKNRCPLPLISETLDRMVGARFFTKLELRDACHRLRIKEGDEWETAYQTRYGYFKYMVMPLDWPMLPRPSSPISTQCFGVSSTSPA